MNGELKLLCLLAGYTALASAILASTSIRGSDSHVLVGLMLGSTFAYAILASSWTILGPGTKKLRLPMASMLLTVFPIVFLFSGDRDIFFHFNWNRKRARLSSLPLDKFFHHASCAGGRHWIEACRLSISKIVGPFAPRRTVHADSYMQIVAYLRIFASTR